MGGNPACKTFIPMLSAYADGELPASDRTNVERHMAACRECTGRVADLRATGGLVRIGMEFATDDVDFKDFAQKVMARVTPEKPPLLERWRLSLSEMFLYQRTPLVASFATAAVLLLVGIPVLMNARGPVGYASPQMAVQSARVVDGAEGAEIQPVVLTTEGGDAIIWVVDEPATSEGDKDKDDDEDDEEVAFVQPRRGGEL